MACDRLTQSTEAGMFEIHMDRNMPRSMMPSRTFSGLFPNGRSSKLAIICEIRCFSSAAPMLNPARNSSTVGSKNWPQISLAAKWVG